MGICRSVPSEDKQPANIVLLTHHSQQILASRIGLSTVTDNSAASHGKDPFEPVIVSSGDVNIEVTDPFPNLHLDDNAVPVEVAQPNMAGVNRGLSISFVHEFCKEHDLWEKSAGWVCYNIIKPACEAG